MSTKILEKRIGGVEVGRPFSVRLKADTVIVAVVSRPAIEGKEGALPFALVVEEQTGDAIAVSPQSAVRIKVAEGEREAHRLIILVPGMRLPEDGTWRYLGTVGEHHFYYGGMGSVLALIGRVLRAAGVVGG